MSSDLTHEFTAACAAGDADAVSRLLEAGVSAVVDSNAPIKVAAANGHLDIVDTLLALPRVNAATDHDEPLRTAAANGHTAVVQRLLSIRGVDPTAANNSAIRSACANGHLPAVKLLLGCGRGVDPSAEKSEALRLAAANGHVEVVRELLTWKNPSGKGGKKGGVDVTACEHEAIRMAAANGHTAVVAELLRVPGVDASAIDSFALRRAAAGGQHEIVSMLMRASKRVDPTANACEALIAACASGHLAVVENLLAPRPSAWPCIAAGEAVDNAFCAAVRGGHEDVALRLLPVPPTAPGSTADSGTSSVHASGSTLRGKGTSPGAEAKPVVADLSLIGQQALLMAAAAGLRRVVDALLSECSRQKASHHAPLFRAAALGQAVGVAAQHTHTNVIAPLVDRAIALARAEPRVLPPTARLAALELGALKPPQPRVLAAFMAAALSGHDSDSALGIVLPLIGDLLAIGDSSREAFQQVVCAAASEDDVAGLQRLLIVPGADVRSACVAALAAAAGAGAMVSMEYLLTEVGVDPAAESGTALRSAVDGLARSKPPIKSIDAVHRLLSDPRVDPAVGDNYAMRTAAACGCIPAVLRLLSDPRVDASFSSACIHNAQWVTGRHAFPELLEHTVAWRRAAVCSEFSAAMRAALKDVAESEAKGPSRRALIAAADAPVDARLIPDLRRAFNLTVITRPNWERRRAAVIARAVGAREVAAAARGHDK